MGVRRGGRECVPPSVGGERALHIALDSWALSAAVVPTPSLDLELIF